jgi:hypothetical protein
MQYVPSGVYFARVRHKGKRFRQSLETDVFTSAKLRRPDKLKVDSIEAADCRDWAGLVRFLAFSGCLISVAKQATWASAETATTPRK